MLVVCTVHVVSTAQKVATECSIYYYSDSSDDSTLNLSCKHPDFSLRSQASKKNGIHLPTLDGPGAVHTNHIERFTYCVLESSVSVAQPMRV